MSYCVQQSNSTAWNQHFASQLSHLFWHHWSKFAFSHLGIWSVRLLYNDQYIKSQDKGFKYSLKSLSEWRQLWGACETDFHRAEFFSPQSEGVVVWKLTHLLYWLEIVSSALRKDFFSGSCFPSPSTMYSCLLVLHVEHRHAVILRKIIFVACGILYYVFTS